MARGGCFRKGAAKHPNLLIGQKINLTQLENKKQKEKYITLSNSCFIVCVVRLLLFELKQCICCLHCILTRSKLVSPQIVGNWRGSMDVMFKSVYKLETLFLLMP